MRPFDLAGLTALVTGAGSDEGIGFASARLLGRLGARVAVTSTTDRIHARRQQLADEGIEAWAGTADLTDPDQVRWLVDAAAADLGTVSILVNNAGMTSLSEPGVEGGIGNLSADGWRSELDRNLTSTFLVTTAVVAGMLEAGWGRVVNMASVSGPVAAYAGDVAYHAAKAGVVGFTRATAVELARRGITVNAGAPGWIRTSTSVREAQMGEATPVGRSGTAEEVGGAVAYLCSREAAYVTGQVLVVDGGNTVAEERGAFA